jgi:hypothetical protein
MRTGPRSCISSQLVSAEPYLTLVSLHSPGASPFELFDKDESEVELVQYLFVPSPASDSKGVRAMIE